MEVVGLIQENTTKVEEMELFIINSLLRGENVIIPDFGHLEIKILGDRRTILFKPSKGSGLDSFSQAMAVPEERKRKNIFAIYNTVSATLKEEKLVSLPQIGLFHPIRRENGEIQVSFMPSSAIRKLLSEEDEKDLKRKEAAENGKGNAETVVFIYDDLKNRAPANEAPNRTSEAPNRINETANEIKEEERGKKSETPELISAPNKNEVVFKPSTLVDKKQPLPEVVVEAQDDNTEKPKSYLKFLLIGVAVFFFLAVAAVTVHSRYFAANKKFDDSAANESINLPSLAEQHYGNPVFWIYIYDANKDKLNSPINIPRNVSLVFPDLKKDYDVDITDSLEIVRANIYADYILKKGK